MEPSWNDKTRRLYKRDSVYALLSLALGYLFSELILFGGFGIAVPLFTAAFYLLALCYLGPEKIRMNSDSVVTFAAVALLSLCFALYDNEFLRFFNVLALILLIPLNLTYFAGANEFRFFSSGSAWEVLRGIFVFPFTNMDKGLKALTRNGRNSSKTSRVIKAAAGILLISPVAAAVLLLLANSDAAFGGLMSGVTAFFREKWSGYLFKFICAFLVSFPIFSFLFSVFYQNRNYSVKKYNLEQKARAIDPVYVNSALWVLCTIYILFIFTQIAYFFSAFRNALPGGFTYAGYARNGFFQLAAVCFINLIFIVFELAFSRRENNNLTKSSKITASFLSLLTILLIITAFSKMAMYIGNFGLTPDRLYATWFMTVLLFFFLFVIIRMFTRRFRLIKATALIFTALYLVLNFADLDSMIPAYNIAHPNGKTGVDIAVFSGLSDSMVPQAAKLLGNPVYSSNLEALLKERREKLKNLPWQQWSAAGLKAEHTIDEALGK